MKINVYQEQYRSGQAHHNPGKIGFGVNAEAIGNLGSAVVNFAHKQIEQNDEINSARIEADTRLAAEKLYRDYQETADPDDFERGVEIQKTQFQDLVQQQSQRFKLPKSRAAFISKMTSSLEPAHMKNVLTYGYELQEARYKDRVKTALDPYKSALLAGATYITVDDTITKAKEYYTEIARQYNIPVSKLQEWLTAEQTSIIESYAYGMVNNDPILVRDLLVGNSFEKFKTFKASQGQDFNMQAFWGEDSTLRDEYASSEYAAKWTDYSKYLNYDTRMDLWKLANKNIEAAATNAKKQQNLQNSMSSYEVDVKLKDINANIEASGKLPVDILGPSVVTEDSEPSLGSIGKAISMGEISKGKLAPGNSYSQQAKDFAGGISGGISARGIKTKLTSNIRPGDYDSKHKTGDAVDLVFTNNEGEMSDSAIIYGYKEAITKYSNNMRKKATLLEIDPSRLGRIRAAMEAEGIDTSYIDWEQSKKYGAQAFAKKQEHVHFGVDGKADYTKTNAGKGLTLNFKTQFGKLRYDQQRADGKSIEDAYDKAKKDELEIFSKLYQKEILNNLAAYKTSEGRYLDPSYWTGQIEQFEQETLNNTEISAEEHYLRLQAAAAIKEALPELQTKFVEDPAQFIKDLGQGNTAQEIAQIQALRYGFPTDKIVPITKAEAKVKVDQILNKLPVEESLAYFDNTAVTTGVIKQLSTFVDKGNSKFNLMSYYNMGTASGKDRILQMLKNWDAVELAKAQETKARPLFPTDWKSSAISKFNKNAIMKNYLSDMEKLNKPESYRMLDAFATLYSYEKAKGADSDKIVEAIVNDFISNNYGSITVRSPRQGNSSVSIGLKYSKDFDKIKAVCDSVLRVGVNPDSIGLAREWTSGKTISEKAAATASNNVRAHQLELIKKSQSMTGAPNGEYVVITGQYDNLSSISPIYGKHSGAPLSLTNKEMIEIYEEASKLMETWKHPNSDTYVLPVGANWNYYGSEVAARNAAIEHVLTNKLFWLNKSDYTDLKFKKATYVQPSMYAEGHWEYSDVASAEEAKYKPIPKFYTGNIDLYNRPKVRNADGSISTVRSMSYSATIDGKRKEILIPTISDEGKIMEKDEAIKYWKAKGQHLGIYNSKTEANKAADLLHRQQEKLYK